jgi:hypothetical protein
MPTSTANPARWDKSAVLFSWWLERPSWDFKKGLSPTFSNIIIAKYIFFQECVFP